MPVKPLFDDQELLIRVAKRDERAFRMIYDRYRSRVYTFSLHLLQSHQQAEDVLQEVFLTLWNLGDRAASIRYFSAWLRVATRNRCLNVLRHRLVEERTENHARRGVEESHNETDELILLNDSRRLIDEAVATLPKQQRLVYRLCQQGLDHEEVARRLKVSPLTVKSHLQHAIRALRKKLGPQTGLGILLLLMQLR